MTVQEWIHRATETLKGAGIASARLDAELLLAHTLRKPRTWLHAHGDDILSDRHYEIVEARLDLRLDRVPIAYIIGHKEFYGRRFKVTTATLIPRPESEDLISLLEVALPSNTSLLPTAPLRLVDVGTGSGILGITAKLEHPELEVTLLDISRHALQVAEDNARALDADVTCIQSDLLGQYPYIADIIIANLPYVDAEWERSPETNHEPATALFAADNGKALIYILIEQTASVLKPGGYIILEADPVQHDDITRRAAKYRLVEAGRDGYGLLLQKLA
ncbi:peptide chain release factor N(5)-glutamine methyltransferase [Candidatus Saccharibacteria bacterium TM7i]|nr:peptide chain release factor N(5)-glutamine methyltransferase [Candidatus Saccharibacteria bacterium TM7i]